MFRSVLLIAFLAASNLAAADFSGRWAGTMETNGNRVPIYVVLNEFNGIVGGSVATGTPLPIYLASPEPGSSTLTGALPAAIEDGEVHDGELSFVTHDRTRQTMRFRLTLANGVLGGDVTVGNQTGKVAVVPIGGGSGSGNGAAGFGIGSGAGRGSGSGAPGSGGGVYRVGGGVSAPTLIRKVEPQYTEEARAARREGTVVLYVEIGPDGAATNIRVQRSLGLGLDERAIEAVKQWRFKPGEKEGQPVTVSATIEVNFRL